MPLTRSTEDLTNHNERGSVSFTVDVGSPRRLRPRNNAGQAVNTPQAAANSNNSIPDQHIRQLISNSFSEFRGEMVSLITNELQSMFRNMNLTSNRNASSGSSNEASNTPTNVLTPSNDRTVNASEVVSNNSPRSQSTPNSTQDTFYAEKVSNIIRNWRIKYTGHDNSISVEDFIYRVNMLTTNNLNADFDLLAKHAHCLFDGKALAFYWRFDRQSEEKDWFSLTSALHKQYKADYTDFDILDDIRRRKQRSNETIDDYLDAISTLTDKLNSPISDRDLCETLLHNLKTEIRNELLHLKINSVSELRREVRRHEKFVKDLQYTDQKRLIKGKIAELSGSVNETEIETEDALEICSMQTNVKCWNCDGKGHLHKDCMESRNVFCYGCGSKNAYRPTCQVCSNKATRQGNGQRDVRRK